MNCPKRINQYEEKFNSDGTGDKGTKNVHKQFFLKNINNCQVLHTNVDIGSW